MLKIDNQHRFHHIIFIFNPVSSILCTLKGQWCTYWIMYGCDVIRIHLTITNKVSGPEETPNQLITQLSFLIDDAQGRNKTVHTVELYSKHTRNVVIHKSKCICFVLLHRNLVHCPTCCRYLPTYWFSSGENLNRIQ